ncbi:DUF262 domain-containing protein [Vibrio sp. SCSIO 43155]|uniref:DUF262 domain-containing protein n=1 Tax=Vibrio sp. SCSIO 43155 TaxID=2819099 RepID=UPI002074E336|nr:DUF262 domain-containing protein [Vibrio sp. SCSIO 43155]USD58599.1 DUF262 domain-containing protein [Vibrio sp. SCSIO 43155]
MDSIYKDTKLFIRSSNAILSYYLIRHDEGELYFNPKYQRSYCWTETEQQQLLNTIFDGEVIGFISSVINENGPVEHYLEVVDGRQRLTTLIMFYKNEIPVLRNGTEYYFDDLNNQDKLKFKQTKLSTYELSNSDGTMLTELQKARYFYSTNFAGVPQSEEHRDHVAKYIERNS